MRWERLFFVFGRIETGEGFFAFYTSSADSAMFMAALVAGICMLKRNPEIAAQNGYVPLGNVAERRNNPYSGEGSRLDGLVDCRYEFRPAVRVDGMISAMVRNEHSIQATALGHAGGD